jgi:hypothetical protein
VFERYVSSEALLEHSTNIGQLMDEIFATGSVSGEVWGRPSLELEKELKSNGVRILEPFQSM